MPEEQKQQSFEDLNDGQFQDNWDAAQWGETPDADYFGDENQEMGQDPQTEPAMGQNQEQYTDQKQDQDTEVQQPPVNKEDPSRFEYWQSQADKFRSQLEYQNQRLSEYEQFAPLIRYIEQNPQVLDAIDQAIQQPGTMPQGQQQRPQGPPEAPKKPAKFDRYEAMENPESESAKYLEAYEQYQQDMTQYMVGQQQSYFERIEKERQQQMAMQQQRQQMAQLNSTLQSQYGLSPVQSAQFIRDMSDDATLDMASLVDYWKWKRQANAQNAPNRQQMNEQHKKAQYNPPPVGGQPNMGGQQINPAYAFAQESDQWAKDNGIMQ